MLGDIEAEGLTDGDIDGLTEGEADAPTARGIVFIIILPYRLNNLAIIHI